MVEFAIVLSLQLFIILGGLQVGLLLLDRMRLTHAAQQAALVGVEDGCPAALRVADEIYGEPVESECRSEAGLVLVGLRHHIARMLPVLPDSVTVTARAVATP